MGFNQNQAGPFILLVRLAIGLLCLQPMYYSYCGLSSFYYYSKEDQLEVLWLGSLVQELGFSCIQPIKMFCDNDAAIKISENPVFHERTKHIEIDCHFIRHHISNGFLQPLYVATE